MSEEEPTSATSESDLEEAATHNLPDSLLQRLQRSANLTGSSVAVTVSVGGAFISGRIVGGRAFFRALAAEVGEDTSLGRVFIDEANDYEDPEAFDADTFDSKKLDWRDEPVYLHLLEARRIGPPWSNLESWRGRLSSIDGWSLGTFSPPSL